MKYQKPFAKDYPITCDFECHLAYSTAPGIDWALPRGTPVLLSGGVPLLPREEGHPGLLFLRDRALGWRMPVLQAVRLAEPSGWPSAVPPDSARHPPVRHGPRAAGYGPPVRTL